MKKLDCVHICPYCKGEQSVPVFETRTVSTIAGGIVGLTLGVAGKDIPGSLPVKIIVGGVTGALAGFYSGCLLGKRLGEDFDENILQKRTCIKCHRTFYS